MKAISQPVNVITKRTKIGVAWNKSSPKLKEYVSGFITADGLRLLNVIASQKKGPINFYLLPNFAKKLTPGQPDLLVFVPYWTVQKEK
jgi:hypothetical protein